MSKAESDETAIMLYRSVRLKIDYTENKITKDMASHLVFILHHNPLHKAIMELTTQSPPKAVVT